MEDFIDSLLMLLLLLVLLITGLLIYLLFNAPGIAYLLIGGLMSSAALGVGLWLRRIYRRKRLGTYYALFAAIGSAKKELFKTINQLDRPLKRLFLPLYPKLNTLCKEAQQTLSKVQEIDRALQKLEARPPDQKSIHAIQTSKIKYLNHIQQSIQFLQQANTQIIALKHSRSPATIEPTIKETLDELLIELEAIIEGM